MPDKQTNIKQPPASVTDPLLNANRLSSFDINTDILKNYNLNKQIQYQNSIQNVNGVAPPIIADRPAIYRELPKTIQFGASLIKQKTILEAQSAAAKAAGIALLKKAQMIDTDTANFAIKGIYKNSENLDINSFETANYERWKEQDDKIKQQEIQRQKQANLQRINDSMSPTGYRDDHVSAYFKNK